MIAQQGRIVALEGDQAIVGIGGITGCPACDSGKGCGAGVFGKLLRNREVSIRLKNSVDAQPGESVRLGISEERFLALVFRLYVWPLLAGLVGAALGFALATRQGYTGFVADMWSLGMALGSAGICLFWSRRRLREFPFNSAVHFLEPENASNRKSCSIRSDQEP